MRWLLISMLAVASLPAAAAAQGDDVTARAKALFKQGVADFESGKYETALSSFQEAQRLKPHPMVQVNMANCYDKLGRPLEAIFHFEQVLQSGAASNEQKKDIAKAVRRLMRRVSDVTFHVVPDGATVLIDGGEQRRAPILEPVRMVAGSHRIEAHLPGYRSASETFEAHGGRPTDVHVTLEREEPVPVAALAPAPEPGPIPAAPPAPVEGADEEPPPAQVVDASTVAPRESPPESEAATDFDDGAGAGSSAIPLHVWIVGGASAALLLAAGISGLIANGAQSDFEDSTQRYLSLRNNATVSAYDKVRLFDLAVEDADRADSLALTTDVLLVAGLIGGGVTATLLFLHSRRDEPGNAHVGVTPIATPHGAGLSLSGAF